MSGEKLSFVKDRVKRHTASTVLATIGLASAALGASEAAKSVHVDSIIFRDQDMVPEVQMHLEIPNKKAILEGALATSIEIGALGVFVSERRRLNSEENTGKIST